MGQGRSEKVRSAQEDARLRRQDEGLEGRESKEQDKVWKEERGMKRKEGTNGRDIRGESRERRERKAKANKVGATGRPGLGGRERREERKGRARATRCSTECSELQWMRCGEKGFAPLPYRTAPSPGNRPLFAGRPVAAYHTIPYGPGSPTEARSASKDSMGDCAGQPIAAAAVHASGVRASAPPALLIRRRALVAHHDPPALVSMRHPGGRHLRNQNTHY